MRLVEYLAIGDFIDQKRQCGLSRISTGTKGNTSYDREITFNPPFDEIPIVTVSIVSGQPHRCFASASAISKTGMTITSRREYDVSANPDGTTGDDVCWVAEIP